MTKHYPKPAGPPAKDTIFAPRPDQPDEPMQQADVPPAIQSHPSHRWAEDVPQTRCVVCGAYRHLSSGLEPCEASGTTALAVARQPSPLAIIEQAIAANIGPAALKELTDLAERWRAMDAKQKFNESMTACQGEMPSIVNDAENPQTRSRYPKFETLLRAAKPVWTRHGFALSFGTADGAPPDHFRIVCDVRHVAGHVERYQADIGVDGIGPKGNPIGGMNRPQASGSGFAYGQRYLTKLIFCLAFANEDDDAVTRISEKEVAHLNELIESCREAGNEVDFEAFLKVYQVGSLAEMTVDQARKAEVLLQRKRAGKAGVK
jgi:hypothetical protein